MTKQETETVALPPLMLCDNVHDYFLVCLGQPHNRSRLGELREMRLDSTCGRDCQLAIDAAAMMMQAINSAVGTQTGLFEGTRATALYVCEIFAFG